MVPTCGLFASVAASYLLSILVKVYSKKDVESGLTSNIAMSGVIATVTIWLGGCLAHEDAVRYGENAVSYVVPFCCVLGGMWSTLAYIWTAEYFTSAANVPVL
jgi:hypothetical protein